MLVLINPDRAAVDVGAAPAAPIRPDHAARQRRLREDQRKRRLPSDHVTDDQNTFVTVDPADMGIVATGNVGPEGVEGGNIEVEWEINSYPLFAWAGPATAYGHQPVDLGLRASRRKPDGDLLDHGAQACMINGDCARPCVRPVSCGETCVSVNFNYHSELHPPQAIAITRTHRYRNSPQITRSPGATRADVWISPDGGGAGDGCFLTIGRALSRS